MKQAATQWAPPTALQEGLIGPHWSKGWIIENNTISDSRCTGISLGKEESTGHNEWTTLFTKMGHQREQEVIFRAFNKGWSKDNIGGHIVRNNHIYNCGQAGIVGIWACIQWLKTIIHHITYKRSFTVLRWVELSSCCHRYCYRNNIIHNPIQESGCGWHRVLVSHITVVW